LESESAEWELGVNEEQSRRERRAKGRAESQAASGELQLEKMRKTFRSARIDWTAAAMSSMPTAAAISSMPNSFWPFHDARRGKAASSDAMSGPQKSDATM
jgi:hypothetical protein